MYGFNTSITFTPPVAASRPRMLCVTAEPELQDHSLGVTSSEGRMTARGLRGLAVPVFILRQPETPLE